MAYILRTHIKKKYLFFGLCSVYGINYSLANNLCSRLGFSKKFLVNRVTEEDIYAISQLVNELNLTIKGDLQRWLKQNVDKLLSIKSYRGIRQKQGLPLRGQRTHTNMRTVKSLRLKKKKL